MLALKQRGAAATLEPPDDNPSKTRNEVNALLGTLGPLLFAASRAADGPVPRSAYPPLRAAARAILALTGHV